ncbi:uncharacterized protein F5Z01DRAFT_643005 [Emericellopsis atlantica]|uniref:Wings apart-like protein C-terminal domain-containing protein n=1 Tax=Emericellopsis atlantica TaxID=2614577 RepID=A0A9P7ZV25_9HYPO|nr:uncharacterized protein F5Z01DRAFT_643005 [Emericellopsis atlantica]KAG9258336.1 hypothetical protein F5Z01DRAFT_643005 [Emericellopsis atlantica]
MMASQGASRRPMSYSKRDRQNRSTESRMDVSQIDPYDIPDDDETTPRAKATYSRLNRNKPTKRNPSDSTADPYEFPSSEETVQLQRAQPANTAGNRLKPVPRPKRTPSKPALVERASTVSKSPETGVKRKMNQMEGRTVNISCKRYATERTEVVASKANAKAKAHDLASVKSNAPMPPSTPKERHANRIKTPKTAYGSDEQLVNEAESRKLQQSVSLPSRAAANTGTPVLPHAQRKSRLIDTLAAQANEDSEPDSDLDDEPTPRNQRFATPVDTQAEDIGSASQTPSSQRVNRAGPDTWARSAQPLVSSKKVKRTYGHVRRIREDSHHGSPFALGGDLQSDPLVPSTPGFSSPGPPLDDYDMEDDDGLAVNFKSVHELKREGANHRFTDVMDEMHLRIGIPTEKPSSLRRNALLELAQKLQESSFAVQFRDSTIRDDLARSIGQENDIISGFAMVAALVVFLSSHSAPNLLQRLVEEGLGKLLARLLQKNEDIMDVASQRSTNLSKSTKSTMSKLVTEIKRMKIWHGRTISAITPRTLTLRLMQDLQHHLDVRLMAQVFEEIEDRLDMAMEDEVMGGYGKRIDGILILHILQHSTGYDNSQLTPQQFDRRAACCLRFFEMALEKWPDTTTAEADTAVLKWTINTTNSKAGAAVFGTPQLLDNLASSIHATLRQSYEASYEDFATDGRLLDVLPLAMCVMINIMEHHPLARRSLQRGALKSLGSLYFELRPSIVDADTEEKSKVSVAVGYLAIILGYCALEESGRTIITGQGTPDGIQDITEAIGHFVALQRTVDARVHELEHLVSELQQVTRRRKAI